MTRNQMLDALEINCNGYFWHHYMIKTQYYDLIDLVSALIKFYEAADCLAIYGGHLAIAYELYDILESEYEG